MSDESWGVSLSLWVLLQERSTAECRIEVRCTDTTLGGFDKKAQGARTVNRQAEVDLTTAC